MAPRIHLLFRVFIGYDPREAIAFEVCRHSLLKHSSIPLRITPIKQSDLRSSGLYWRHRGPTESTESTELEEWEKEKHEKNAEDA